MYLTVLVGIFMAMNGFAYDGTGVWNYSAHSPVITCQAPYPGFLLEDGEAGILQDGNSFLIVKEDLSTYGTVNGTKYTFSDEFCYDQYDPDGYIVVKNEITLTSATNGTGKVSWDYYEGSVKWCSGNHMLDLTKQSQTAPLKDATGKWNYTQTPIANNCDEPGSLNPSGYFTVTQTGNKITAVDNENAMYSGYVSGNEYAVVRSYSEKGGRTTEWLILTLTSKTEGAGEGKFVWDDDCDYCGGRWSISATKEVYTITATATAGGSISPSGAITVDVGVSQGFQIDADSGYVITDVLVDNSSIGAISSYTFDNVSKDHTIHAVFQLDAGACLPCLLLLL
jgi:hypothetical protein